MRSKSKTMRIIPSSGNVFIDLGYEPNEASELLAQARAVVAAKLAIKEFLVSELARWINEENHNQNQAAKVLGVSQSCISDVFKRHTTKLTIDALIMMLSRAGKNINVSVS